MSARASAYAKSLLFCPNGERITRGEKLVLISLADSHQDKGKHFTYPSIETIATDALCDRRSCQRHLEALERKGVIRRLRPARQGAGMTTFYFFLELEEVPEGWQNAALFSEPKGGIRAAKGRQKGDKTCIASITNTNQKQELKDTPPTPASGGACGSSPSQAAGEAIGPARDRARQEISRSVELATDQAMQGCGFTALRLRRVLRAVIEQRRDAGDPEPTTALGIIAAWKDYTAQGALLRARWGPARFFAEGHWSTRQSWMWDGEALRDMQRAMH